MRNRGSNKRAQGKALENQMTAWRLVVTEGLPYSEAAEQLCVSTKAIQRYINRTLESAGSSFPSDLAPAEINKLRQLQSEILLSAMAKVIRQMDAVEKAAGIDADAKLLASSAGLSRLSYGQRTARSDECAQRTNPGSRGKSEGKSHQG